jgi:site-specific recombinase XerD
VFCEPDGTGCDYRKVGDAFRAAVNAAGITGRGRLSLHSLRHSFASLLIANGLNVVFVSRHLGHAKPTTTLAVYAHLFDQAEHARTARAALEASYQTLTEARDEQRNRVSSGNSRGNRHRSRCNTHGRC